MRSATIHVGVNVSNTHPLLLVLPVFADGTFIFIPIPSNRDETTYAQLSNSLPGVCEILTQLGFDTSFKVHNDPEFVEFTFGEGPRNWMLAELCHGDYIFFLSSMKQVSIPSKMDFLKRPEKYKENIKNLLKQFRGHNWFYGLIAQIKISEIYAGKNEIRRYDLRDSVHELNAKSVDKVKTNAHVKRGDHLSGDYIIVKGDMKESKIYDQALPISQGNTCLTELENIFYEQALKRNRGKWFEAIFETRGTKSLLNFIDRNLWMSKKTCLEHTF
jgi:hypothetical protein